MGGGLIWLVQCMAGGWVNLASAMYGGWVNLASAMYKSEYNMNVTRSVGDCFQSLLSNPGLSAHQSVCVFAHLSLSQSEVVFFFPSCS